MIRRLILAASAALALLSSAPALAQANDPTAQSSADTALGVAKTNSDTITINAQNARLKRAAARAYAFNPEDAPANANGATLTMGTTVDSTLTRVYGPVAGGTALTSVTMAQIARFTGGHYMLDTNSRPVFPVASAAPATNGNMAGSLPTTPGYQAWGWGIEFMTDAPRVQFRLAGYTTHAVRVIVDGQYVSKTPLAYSVNGGNYLTIDLPTPRAPHSIRLEGMQNDQPLQVAVAPTTSLWRATNTPDRVIALATGDSYSEGQGATYAGLYAWPQALGRTMGWSDVRQVAVGSTGYLANSSGNRKTIRTQIPDWFTINSDIAPADVDIITVAGGYNDYTQTASAVQAEALLTFQAMRAACPNAIIVVFGNHAGARGPDTQTLAIEAAIKTAFTQWGDARSYFVPLAADASPWTFGTGYVGATNGSGNSDFAISADATHPSDQGHQIYRLRAAAAIRSIFAGLPN